MSGTAPVWILYLRITDSSLRLGIYDTIRHQNDTFNYSAVRKGFKRSVFL